MPEPNEISLVNLPPEQRREAMAQYMLGNPVKVTGKALAQLFGVSEATVTADLKSDEYLIEVEGVVHRFLKANLIPSAMKNVGKAVLGGDLGTSKWLLELTCKYFSRKFVEQIEIIIRAPEDAIPDDQILRIVEEKIASGAMLIPMLKSTDTGGNGNDNGNRDDSEF